MKNSYKTLRLILGDQLNYRHSWFRDADPSVLYVIAELHQETNYVRHHIQKVCGFFAAMKAFAKHIGKIILARNRLDIAAIPSLYFGYKAK